MMIAAVRGDSSGGPTVTCEHVPWHEVMLCSSCGVLLDPTKTTVAPTAMRWLAASAEGLRGGGERSWRAQLESAAAEWRGGLVVRCAVGVKAISTTGGSKAARELASAGAAAAPLRPALREALCLPPRVARRARRPLLPAACCHVKQSCVRVSQLAKNGSVLGLGYGLILCGCVSGVLGDVPGKTHFPSGFSERVGRSLAEPPGALPSRPEPCRAPEPWGKAFPRRI